MKQQYLFLNTAFGIEVFLHTFEQDYYIKVDDNRETSSILLGLIDGIIKESNVKLEELDYLGVCIGPGSFTGIRIGVNTIKGLALVTNLPIKTINTLELNAYNVISNSSIASIINGSNGVLYVAKYSIVGDMLSIMEEPKCIYLKDVDKYLSGVTAVVFDNGETADICNKDATYLRQGRIIRAINNNNKLLSCEQVEPLYIRKAQPDRVEGDI